MGTRQRPVDRGAERGRRLVIEIGRELRIARRDRGLSLRTVGEALRCSASELSRIERGLVPGVSLDLLARTAAAVGLDLAAKCYPGGTPLRERGHHEEIAAFRAELHPLLGFRTEVQVAGTGDQRTWDAMVEGVRWRTGVECEMSPSDWQALERRLELKQRDGNVDFLILLLPDTRHVRELLRATHAEASARFPVPGRTILARLRAGESPGGSGIVVLRRHPERVAPGTPAGATGRESAPSLAPRGTTNAPVLDLAPGTTGSTGRGKLVTVGAPRATRSGGRRGRAGAAEGGGAR
jgi:transcriptional regulator with XRE-family HTH domain